jgi:hypothetical protein
MNKDNKLINYWAHMLDESTGRLDERRMAGPAAARNGGVDEIAEFRGKLAAGVVEFEFTKADGTLRHAVGTTNEQVVPTTERRRLDPDYDENLESYRRREAFIIWFWDLEKNECRCFNTNRFERLIGFEPTNRHVDMNVDRVGNIFIHRDVDAGMEGNAPLNDDRIEEINGDIDDFVAAGGDWLGNYFGGINMNNDVGAFEIERGPAGEPVLRIEIRKRGNNNDQPYQLQINELRQAINRRWNVDVKKVIVDGVFEY